jgi:hypothetical protein
VVTGGLLALASGCGGGAPRDVAGPTPPSGMPATPPCDEPRLVELDAWLAESPGDGELSVVPRLSAMRGLDDPTFGPRQHAEVLWTGCAVERLSIATSQEWLRAGPLAEVAIATAGWLREVGVSPARVRAYARALAGLNAPSVPSLAQRFPEDGLGDPPPPPPPPPPRGRARHTTTAGTALPSAGGVDGVEGGSRYGRSPVTGLDVTLSFYLGREDIAQSFALTVREAAPALARCFEAFAAPGRLTLRLLVADGIAQDGELLRVRDVGNVKHVETLNADPAFTRCLLARAGRLHFAPFARPTTVELDLSPHRPAP